MDDCKCKQNKAVEILKPYALACLGEIARGVTDLGDEIESAKMYPDIFEDGKRPADQRIEFAKKRRDETVSYMAKVIDDLRKAGIIVDADKPGEQNV